MDGLAIALVGDARKDLRSRTFHLLNADASYGSRFLQDDWVGKRLRGLGRNAGTNRVPVQTFSGSGDLRPSHWDRGRWLGLVGAVVRGRLPYDLLEQ